MGADRTQVGAVFVSKSDSNVRCVLVDDTVNALKVIWVDTANRNVLHHADEVSLDFLLKDFEAAPGSTVAYEGDKFVISAKRCNDLVTMIEHLNRCGFALVYRFFENRLFKALMSKNQESK